MNTITETINEFIARLENSLEHKEFVKLILSNYKGIETNLNKVFIRLTKTNKGEQLYIQIKYDTRDIIKTLSINDGVSQIRRLIEDGFRNGHLFTLVGDHQLTIGKRSAFLTKGKSAFKAAVSPSHDREKRSVVDQNAFYLKALGITTDTGEIRAKQRDKWKQINKFVEVLAGEIERADLKNDDPIKIVDMGSGKGYLTFAAYDHLNNQLGIKTHIKGIDIKKDTVDLCNSISLSGGFDGLSFEVGTIESLKDRDFDVLVALHACDTATDDALYQGIAAKAKVIIAAPCCHKEVKKQLRSPELLAGILKHPVMLERTAETITDGIRSLLLEASGYKTKMFEFVATEHTPKNNLIVASLTNKHDENIAKSNEAVERLLAEYHITDQRLVDLLKQAG